MLGYSCGIEELALNGVRVCLENTRKGKGKEDKAIKCACMIMIMVIDYGK